MTNIDIERELFELKTSNTPLELTDGTFIEIPPYPEFGFLGDDETEAYEELQFETESYDRVDDVVIPAVTEDDGRVVPARTVKGPLRQPYQQDGKLVKPSFRVRVARAALGDETYAKLKADGKGSADVWKVWNSQVARAQTLLESLD